MNLKELTFEQVQELIGKEVLAILKPSKIVITAIVKSISIGPKGQIEFKCYKNTGEAISFGIDEVICMLEDENQLTQELDAFLEFIRVRPSIEKCLREFAQVLFEHEGCYFEHGSYYSNNGTVLDNPELLDRINSIITTESLIEPLRLSVYPFNDSITFKLVFDSIRLSHKFKAR